MGAEILAYKSKRNEIAARKTGEYEYEAKSESKKRLWYRIAHALGKRYCECRGFAHTGRACKHIAAMKNLYDAKPPPAAPCRGYLRLHKPRRLGRAIKTPPIKCRFCRSKRFGTSFVRENEHRNVQVYRCHSPKCGRRFSPDNGFLHMKYREGTVIRAIEDRCGGKTTHNILDSLHKTSEKPARSTLHTWFVKFPRLVSDYLFSLTYQLSPVMLVDEIMAKVRGIMHAIYPAEDEGTRMCTAIQFGRRKGSRNVRRLYKMDMEIRGFVPELVKSDGEWGFSSAHKATMRYNDSGTTLFHIRHIHADGDMNTNMKEKHNDTMREFERSCRGLKTPHTTYMAMHQIHYNFARTHTELGMSRPRRQASGSKIPTSIRVFDTNSKIMLINKGHASLVMARMTAACIAAAVLALIAPMAAVDAAVPLPLVQTDAGAAAGGALCNPGRLLLVSPGGNPACALGGSYAALEGRGWSVAAAEADASAAAAPALSAAPSPASLPAHAGHVAPAPAIPTVHPTTLAVSEYPVVGQAADVTLTVTYGASGWQRADDFDTDHPLVDIVIAHGRWDTHRVYDMISNIGTGDLGVFLPYDPENSTTTARPGETYTVKAKFGAPALPYAHAAEPQQPQMPMPPVFNATGTVTTEGYAQGGAVPVHGIQVCVYDLTYNGTAVASTTAAIALSPLNTTKGAPACAYTDRGGAYSIPGVVGSDPHDETRADVVVSVASRGYGGAVSVVGHEAGEYRLYRADSGVAADYNGTLHKADFELGKAANRSSPPSFPRTDAGAAGAARIVSALSDGLSFFEGYGRAPEDLAVWWQHPGGSGEFPREAGGGGEGGIYPPDAFVLRLGGDGSGSSAAEAAEAETRDDSRSRWAILSGLARHVHDSHNPGLGLHHCRDGYDARQIGDKQGAACAWAEGWASLAPHLIDGRAAMAGPHGYEIDIEAAADAPGAAGGNGRPFAAFEVGGRAVGEWVPGRVAAAMWDMADEAADPVHDAQTAGEPAGPGIFSLPRRTAGDSAPPAAAGGRDDIAAGTGRLLGVFFNGTYGSFAEFYDRWEIDMRDRSAERVAMLHGMSFAVPNSVPYYEPVGRLGGLFGSGLAGLELVPNNVAVSADGSIVAVTSERGRGLQLVNVSGGGAGESMFVGSGGGEGLILQLVNVSGGGAGDAGGSGGMGRHIGLYAARGHDYSCMLERDRDACMENPATFGPDGPPPGQFSSMDGVAFSPDGETLIVSDGQWNRISMFGPDGSYAGHFGTPHLTAGPADGPADLPLEGDGEFYCSYLETLPAGGRDLGDIYCGGGGGAPLPAERPVGAGGEFHRLGGVVFLPDGTAAAADGGNRRIRLLEIGGDGITGAAGGARVTGQFASYSPDLLAPFTAQHIAADPSWNVYAAGGAIPGLWVYDGAGLGGGALLVSGLSLGAPGGIAAGVDGLVYVSDRENGRIRAYDMNDKDNDIWLEDLDDGLYQIRAYDRGRTHASGPPWAYASGPYDPLGLRPVAAEDPRAPRAAAPAPHSAGAAPDVLPPQPPAGPFPSHLGALPLEVRTVPSRIGAFVEEFGSPGSGPLHLAGPGGIALGRPGSATWDMRPYAGGYGPNPQGVLEEIMQARNLRVYADEYGPIPCDEIRAPRCGDLRVYVADPNGVIIYERDRERPAVTRVWAHTADGTVRPGGTAEIAVSFSERVTVSGEPVLPLVAGNGSAQGAVYASGSGSHTLTFNYTAGAGDGPGYLDNAGAGSLELAAQGAEGASIMDGSGNGADPALPENGTAASLAANAALWIAPDGGRENGGGSGAAPFGIAPVPPVRAIEGREVRLAMSAAGAAAAGPYTLSGAPAGASIHANGTFSWVPGEGQDGGHAFVVRAASAADPGATHARAVRIAVAESNEPPSIAPIPDMEAAELSELRFDMDASDPDVPAQRLEYRIGKGAPAGATVLPNGTFVWTPSLRDAGVHEFNVSVSDGFGREGARSGSGGAGGSKGAPGTASAAFRVAVADTPQPQPSVVRVYQTGRTLGGGGPGGNMGGGGVGDGTQPGLPGWRALGLPSAYGAGDEIAIAVEFSAPVVVVHGRPELRLDAGGGGSPAVAAYDSGNGTAVLRFKYVVEYGHDSGRLGYEGTGALSAAGGGSSTSSSRVQITASASGVAADLGLPAPGSPGSLSSTSRITVATTSPVLDIGVLDGRAPAGATAYAAWMAAADFNEASDGGRPLLNVTVYPRSPDGAAGALRAAHAGGSGPGLYVGRLGDGDLHDAMRYAADAGIVLVSTDSSSPLLAAEGDRMFRMRPSDGLLADALARIAREDGAESVYAVIENVPRVAAAGPPTQGIAPPDRRNASDGALDGTAPVSLDRAVYPVPFGTPADFAGTGLRGAPIFPIHATGIRDPGAAGSYLAGGDLTIRVRIVDPDFDASADSVDSIAVNVPRGAQDSRTPAEQLGHGPLKITVSRGSSSPLPPPSVVVATAGGESANGGRITTVPAGAGAPGGSGGGGDGVQPGVTRELGPIAEIAPDAGVFELELELRYTDGPAGPMCPVTASFEPLGGGGSAAPGRGPGARFADGAADHCIRQGDVLTVEYTDPAGARGGGNGSAAAAASSSASAVFDLRSGTLESDRPVYIVGGDMVLTLSEPDLNLDGGKAESYDLDLIEWESGAAGALTLGDRGGGAAAFDPDPPRLTETGADTGVFRAAVKVPGELVGGRAGASAAGPAAAGGPVRAAPPPFSGPLAAASAEPAAAGQGAAAPKLPLPLPPAASKDEGAPAVWSTTPGLGPPLPPVASPARMDAVRLEYTDWGPSGAGHVGEASESTALDVSVSNLSATIELDKDAYTWTERVRITAVAPGHNLDPSNVDEIGATDADAVTISTFDFEASGYYRLVETGADTGVFAGEVVLAGFPYDADGDPTTGITSLRDGLVGIDTLPTNGGFPAILGGGETIRPYEYGVAASFKTSENEIVAAAAPVRWVTGIVQWIETGRPGQGGTVRVIDPDMNLDPGSADSFAIDVYSDSDLAGIDLAVVETGNETGVFEAAVSFAAAGKSSGHRLRAAEGDTVTARYKDTTTPYAAGFEPQGRADPRVTHRDTRAGPYAAGIEAATIAWAPAAAQPQPLPDAPANPGAAIWLDRDAYTWTDRVRITAVAPGLNLDPNAVDEIGTTDADAVTISTRAAEIGRYRLVETGADTGVFAGEVALAGFFYDASGIRIDTGRHPSAFGSASGSGPADGSLPAKDYGGITASLRVPGGDAVLAAAPVGPRALLEFRLGDGAGDGAVLAAAPVGRGADILWSGTSHPAQGGIVRIVDPDMNLGRETEEFAVDVYSDSDPAGIDLFVAETGGSTGVFKGAVMFTAEGGSSGRCLRAAEGDTVTIKYKTGTLRFPHEPSASAAAAARPFVGTVSPPFEAGPDAGVSEGVCGAGPGAKAAGPPVQLGAAPAAVVYQGSAEGLAALARASPAYPAMSSAAWLATGPSAGSRLLLPGYGPSNTVATFSAQTGLEAARWSPPESGLAREIDSRLSGADLNWSQGAGRLAYAAYDAVSLLGAAAAGAGGDGSAADAVAPAVVAGRLPAAAAAYRGALGDIALDPAGDLWVPAQYDLWTVDNPHSPLWSRQPGALDEERACSITLEREVLDYGPIDHGQTSRPYRQTISNTGQLPFSEVGIGATPWHVDSPGGCAPGVLPSLPAGLSKVRTEPGGEFADLEPAGLKVAGGLEPGGTAPLWYRLSLAGVAGLPEAEIIQCVTYTVRC